MRKAFRIAGCLIIVLLARLVWLTYAHPSAPPNPLPLAILRGGYTSDTNGVRCLAFTVTNVSKSAYTCLARCRIQIPAATPYGVRTIGGHLWPGGEQTLGPGEFGTVVVPIPTNQVPWRINVFARRSSSLTRFRGRISNFANDLGQRRLVDAFEVHVVDIPGEWIEP